ncbi:hypothetical protein LY76DRAFT_332569 [Colletotrichum caudatum]|nr:hypothetical protein LY76DRAFT_332569 [Colletotrichum caudatum]
MGAAIQAFVLSIRHVDANNQLRARWNWAGSPGTTLPCQALHSKLDPLGRSQLSTWVGIFVLMASQMFCAARTLTDQAELVRDAKANLLPWPSLVRPNFSSTRDDQTDCPSVIKRPSRTGHWATLPAPTAHCSHDATM